MTFGLLRVRNEARWIQRAIRSIMPLCEDILVLDDHSNDGTADLCDDLGCIVYRSSFEGIDETRDKDFLLAQVWALGAKVDDHCIMIDGDEVLHPDDVPAVTAAVEVAAVCCSFHIVYLWDREDQVRIDRWYKEFRRPSLFRLTSTQLTFRRTAWGGNMHCSSAPAQLLDSIVPIPARLLHYGYLHREDRIRKYEWYNAVDPNNALEDQYRHMVVGDVFPADSAFRWAGPLELRPLT